MFPRMIKIRQKFEHNSVQDLPRAIEHELEKVGFSTIIKEGDKVGITVGSRGIKDLKAILRVIVDATQKMKASPHFIAAMGSHGGADASAQARIVREMVGRGLLSIPILSEMDVKKIGEVSGFPVYISTSALKMNKIIVVNRVKSHTDFKGAIGSGLLKMMAIGLGKYKGAEACHVAGRRLGLERVIKEAAGIILKSAPISFGLAITEDAHGDTADVVAVKDGFQDADQVLLAKAEMLMPKLPFDQIDILIIDQIGKDISGNGMDTNIIGRSPDSAGARSPIDLIFVRDLSKLTEGNAIGIGVADATTTKLKNKIDMQETRVNCVTSHSLGLGKIPLAFDSDYLALSALEKIIGKPADKLKIVWIIDTCHLNKCLVSESYTEDIKKRSDLEVMGKSVEMVFDDEGNLAHGLRGI